MKRLTGFLGLNAGMSAMLATVILVGMGERMAERFLPIYLLALGGGAMAIGSLNALTNLLGALYSFPGGWLSDRLGYRRALMVFNGMAMIGYLLVILIPAWWAVLAGAFFFIAWTAVTLPAIMSLVADLLPEGKRTMGVSLHSLVRRIPMALGPLAGGALMGAFGTERGVQLAFVCALVLAGMATLLVVRHIPETRRLEPPRIVWRHLRDHFSPALRRLLVADILIRFAEQIPYAFVVVWAVQNWGVTPFEFGVLTAIEMVTAMLVYIPVAWLADRGTKKPFVVITFLFFTAFPAVLFFSRSFGMLVVAFIVRGLKEFGEPTRKALILDLAPANARAATFGAYYLIRDVIVSVAAFGGAWLWMLSPALNLWTAVACGLAGTLYFALRGQDLGRT